MIAPEWRRLFRLDRNVERDVEDEFSFHFAMRVEQFMAQGMSRDAATYAARAQFGDEPQVRARLLDIGRRVQRRRNWRDEFDTVAQDLVVALRTLRREPLFALGVILTLGLGIGANATMFGIVDGLMLRGPAHLVDAPRVQRLYITAANDDHAAAETRSSVGWVTYAALRDRARSFSGIGAYSTPYPRAFGVERDAPNMRVASVTADLFPMFGVRPVIGRFFLREEDQPPDGQRVAIISERLWSSEFARDEHVLGRRVVLGGESFTVIGVAPSGFAGVDRLATDVWVPMSLTHPTENWATSYCCQWLRVVIRLKDGVAPETANAEATTILRAAYTGQNAGMKNLIASVRPLWFGPRGEISQTANVSRWLLGVAVIVLVITCANVANLMLARTRRRRREVAVRLALGAGGGRVVRFVLAEMLVLAMCGTMVSMAIALVGGRLMRVTLLSNLAWEGSSVDARVFAFALGVALVCVAVVGAVPALDATRVAVAGVLKTSERGGTGARARLRATLSALQAALCVVLLIGAGLFVESLVRSRRVDLGFQADRVVRAELRYVGLGKLSKADAEAERARRRQELLDAIQQLRASREIEHAAVAVGTPFGNSFGLKVRVPGRDTVQLTGRDAHVAAVTDDYFATVGTPLRRGRVFTSRDTPDAARVTIINETMAATLWPGEDALGKCFTIEDGPCAQIVGIVADVHQSSLREARSIQYYVPFGQECCIGGSVLLVRPRGAAATAIPRIRQLLLQMPGMPRVDLATIQTAIDPQYAPWKLGAAMFGVFGVLALIVAAVGLYSVIAYLVVDRTREIGVRIALGATSGRIVREVVVTAIATTTAGIAIGVVVALFAGRFVEPLLFDVSSRNPLVLGSVAAIVTAIAIFAAWSPARRASRVDPVIALRAD
jgi:predicted permease